MPAARAVSIVADSRAAVQYGTAPLPTAAPRVRSGSEPGARDQTLGDVAQGRYTRRTAITTGSPSISNASLRAPSSGAASVSVSARVSVWI